MSIQDTLVAWGRGRAVNSAPNGYPSRAAFALMISRGNVSIPPLADEDFCRIDMIISRMKRKKPVFHQLVTLHYVEGWRDAKIAKQWRFDGDRHSRTWIREQRLAAEAYIEAKID